MKYQKHAKLTKTTIGNFARNEFALMGAPCDHIQEFAKAFSHNIIIKETRLIAKSGGKSDFKLED